MFLGNIVKLKPNFKRPYTDDNTKMFIFNALKENWM